MLPVRYAARFKRDMTACAKRRFRLDLLQQVVDTLRIPDALPTKNRDHNLSGNYLGYRECHIAPDWLLIYRYEEDELLLYRTGTHSDLFGL